LPTPRPASESVPIEIREVDAVPYLRIRDLAAALAYTFAVSEHSNHYIRDAHGDYWNWLTISDYVCYDTERQDANAVHVDIVSDGHGFILYPDDTLINTYVNSGHHSSINHPPRIMEGDMWVSAEDAQRLFRSRITIDPSYRHVWIEQVGCLHHRLNETILPLGFEAVANDNNLIYGVGFAVRTRSDRSDFYILKENGDPLIEMTFRYPWFLDRGKAILVQLHDMRFGVLGLDGEWRIEPVYDGIIVFSFLPLYMASQRRDGQTFHGLYALDGRQILPPIFEELGTTSLVDDFRGYFEDTHFPLFDRDRLGAKLNGKWGLIDLEGNVILPFEYDAIGQVTKQETEWGFSIGGQIYIDDARMALIVQKDGRFGGVDKHGVLIVPFQDEPFP
jgi:hypothetical protein